MSHGRGAGAPWRDSRWCPAPARAARARFVRTGCHPTSAPPRLPS